MNNPNQPKPGHNSKAARASQANSRAAARKSQASSSNSPVRADSRSPDSRATNVKFFLRAAPGESRGFLTLQSFVVSMPHSYGTRVDAPSSST